MFNAVRRTTALLTLAAALALAGCGGGEGDDGPDPGPPPSQPAPPASDTTAPTIPQGVTAIAQTPTQVLVSWTASTDAAAGVAGYRVYRDGSNTALGSVPGTSYTDAAVTANTLYSYTVRAYDAAAPANESALSVSVNVTTPPMPSTPDTTPPTTPTGLTAQALSASEIALSWSGSTDAGLGVAGYRIYRGGGATPIATVQTTNYTDSALSASTAYTYTVRAYDGATPPNESALSGGASATTLAPPPAADTTPPTVPANVTAVALNATSIRVSWSAATDASGISAYRVFRDGSATPVATVQNTVFNDTNLTAATTYSYTVVAVDGALPANASAPSVAASATTATVPPPPDATPPTVPGNVAAAALSASEILVSWTAATDASGISGYSVFRNGGPAPIAIVQTPSFTDTGLSASTTYSYTVRATDGATPANVSEASAPASATTNATPPIVDLTPPTVPGNVLATTQSPSDILVSWSASNDASGISGYRVFRDGGLAPIATVQATNYTDTGLAGSTTYTYTVQAVDAAVIPNLSAPSAPASATTSATPPVADVTPPTVPANVLATAQSSSGILVSWADSTDASGISGYRVFRDGGQTPIATVQGTNYTDTGLAASTSYTYAVQAVDAAATPNVSALSAPANATTSAAAQPGLDARPANTTCLAGDAPSGSVSLAVERAFANLSFSQPVALLQAPGDVSRWFVVEQGGRVRVFANQPTTATATEFINLVSRVEPTGSETGLLGMAFHPDYPADPRVYFSYTTQPMGGMGAGTVSRISEFRTNDGGATVEPNSEVVLLTVEQPEENHKGGNIAFGPDGFLYIGFGDGGGAGDAHGLFGNGQRLTTLLGKMLRIDIDGSTPGSGGPGGDVPYRIPADNPYAGNALCNDSGDGGFRNCPEIYAYGFRNPWRWSFDRGSGELWVGDVGQSAYEEIDRVVSGGNYGWRCREGAHNFNLLCGFNGASLDPIAEVGREFAQAITGGYVYRGAAIPELSGRYVFGDYASGQLWSIPRTTAPTMTMGAGLTTGLNISSFAEDVDGELYLVDYGGTLNRLVAGAGSGGPPALLSATGCVNPADPHQPASGLIPYTVNSAFYSDGASKQRWLALPDGQSINVAANNRFEFPTGSVLFKNFSLGSTLVETRLLMRHNNGQWGGYTYEWNAQGTDATRVIGGKTVSVSGQSWEFPSEAQCVRCHNANAGRTLGTEIAQLNGDFGYPTGRTANQLLTLNAIQTLTPLLAQDPAQLPSMPNPVGAAGTPAERARAYLHANCSYCHQPGGPTPVNMDFRYGTTLLATNACDVAPSQGSLGIANARRIAPGSAARSVLVARVNRVGTDAMPPLARHAIDSAGVQLLTDWINGLSNCN